MAFQIERKQDQRVVRAFSHKVADIPNGGTIASDELAGAILYEGTVVGKGSDGMFHVIKTATVKVAAGSDATTYTVAKGHHFKLGDVVMAKNNAKAYAISAIAENSTDKTCDDITVATTLGVAVNPGDALVLAAKAGASGSDFKYAPVGLVGESYQLKGTNFSTPNIWVNIVTIGQVKTNMIPACPAFLQNAIKGVVFI